MDEDTTPLFESDSFVCPHCGVHAHQGWEHIDSEFLLEWDPQDNGHLKFDGEIMQFSLCARCHKPAFWVLGKMVYPDTGAYPPASDDFPEEVSEIYNEAGKIAVLSPRAACALLRLCLEMLLKRLGQKDNINDSIADLVKKGLPSEIQRAMDTLRVTGNQAVHGGKISFDGDTDVEGLFSLLNAIVYDRITLPKERMKMYDSLPSGAKNQIATRDGRTKP
ncbi:MAG: DUF4145 domain-containing protein [Caldilineaceae bacterium]|nr:DUF4145 domain-containing protein [Caldilineaceae bacterium]